MGKIKFSIIAPAIRRNYYKTFYNSLNKDNNISFEIIFVGFSPPKKKMPSNFKYIYTKVNPAQCWEIAAREAEGEYLILATDDCLFSPKFLNRIDFYINRLWMERSLIGGRYQTNGIFYDNILIYSRKIKNSPLLLSFAVYKKEVWNKIGGIDRRFSGAFCNADIMLRFYEIGYVPFIAPDLWVNEIRNDSIKSSLWKRTGKQGRKMSDSFWIKDNLIVKKRLKPVISFNDKDILIKDQYEGI